MKGGEHNEESKENKRSGPNMRPTSCFMHVPTPIKEAGPSMIRW